MTRRDLNACLVSPLPSPLSVFFESHRRFPQRLALHARRGEASCQATQHHTIGNTVAALPLTIFACSSSGSIGHAHGLFHIDTRVRARALPWRGGSPCSGCGLTAPMALPVVAAQGPAAGGTAVLCEHLPRFRPGPPAAHAGKFPVTTLAASFARGARVPVAPVNTTPRSASSAARPAHSAVP